jgi:hypothetical protein
MAYERLTAENQHLRRELASKVDVIAGKDAQLWLTDTVKAQKDQVIAAEDALLASRDSIIAAKDMIIAQLQQQQQRLTAAGSQAFPTIPPHVTGRHRTALSISVVSQRELKKACDKPEPAFEQDTVMQSIFVVMGARNYFCTASVSQGWSGRYLHFCGGSRDTHWTAAITTKQRLMLAFRHGLTLKMCASCRPFISAVLKQSQDPVGILPACRAKGMPWRETMASGVVTLGNLDMLLQLMALGCPWSADRMRYRSLTGCGLDQSGTMQANKRV